MKLSFLALLAAVGFAVPVSTASAQIFYRETFSATVNNSNPTTVGWAVHHGNGTYYSDFTQNAAGVGSVTGIPTNLGNVNAGSATSPTINPSGQTATGIFFVGATGISGTSPGPAFLAWTNEAGPVAASAVSNISFYLGNTNGAQPVRVAVQANGQWYVSTTTFQNNTLAGAGEFATKATFQSLNITTSASAWNTISFQPNGTNPLTSSGTGNFTLGAGAPANLTGNITAFGIYGNSGSTANVRFDTFTVTAVPEPSAVAALIGVSMLGFAVIRRRRRRDS